MLNILQRGTIVIETLGCYFIYPKSILGITFFGTVTWPNDHTIVRSYDHAIIRSYDYTVMRPYDHTITRSSGHDNFSTMRKELGLRDCKNN